MHDKYTFEKVFSNDRMSKYYKFHNSDFEKALTHYKLNIELSEAFYPILSIYEVSLRNSFNRELIDFFNTDDWYIKISTTAGLSKLKTNVNGAQKQIAKRNEIVVGSKMVAELTMGFW